VLLWDPPLLVVGVPVSWSTAVGDPTAGGSQAAALFQGAGPLATRVPVTHPVLALLVVVLLLVLLAPVLLPKKLFSAA